MTIKTLSGVLAFLIMIVGAVMATTNTFAHAKEVEKLEQRVIKTESELKKTLTLNEELITKKINELRVLQLNDQVFFLKLKSDKSDLEKVMLDRYEQQLITLSR